MKTLKAKTLHPKKQILKISDLAYNKHYTKYDVKLNQGVDNITDIMEEKQFSVHKGGQRVTRAVKLGYTHIEAIVYE